MRDRLYAWLADQERWQQDLARRLLESPDLEGADYDTALTMVKAAFDVVADGEVPDIPQPLRLEELPEQQTSGAPRLVQFGSLRGVGAVSDEHALSFAADGLTSVYGDNAAGKTTYVRALKRVCRTVDRDAQLRGNVFAPADVETPSPSAQVGLQAPGQPDAQRVVLTDPQSTGLEAISVFDSECAELYVDERNEVAFVPSELRVLARLAATQNRMRGDIQAAIHRVSQDEPTFAELPATTAAARLVASLSCETSMDDVRTLATLNPDEASGVADLRAIVASAQAQRAKEDARAAKHDAAQADSLAARLRQLHDQLDADALDRLRGLASDRRTTKAAADAASADLGELPLQGVGEDAWQGMWRAARSFAEHVQKSFPPPAGERCPLCQQEVTSDTASRLAHFDEHVRSTVQEEARKAEHALAEALVPLQDQRVQELRGGFLEGLEERDSALFQEAVLFLETVGQRFSALREDPAGAVTTVDAVAVDHLDQWSTHRKTYAANLRAAAEPERQAELRRELNELEAREKLRLRLDDVEQRIGRLRAIHRLEQAHTALATNRITTKQRELSEETVTGALNSALQVELRNLGSHIPVELHPHTRVGEPEVALRLAGARGTPRVSDIASEGEQRALSLAFFLAEIETSNSDGGIVVDDPVSSLDETRREYIAKRLVTEAGRRQVIVFTHDLPFTFDLREQGKEAGLTPTVQGVWRLGGGRWACR
jgi:energy-coupling factor transporter ATP-binding protein EcfA2